MKVILLQDVKKQGKKDDIIEVSDGYAKNYLIKNNLAVAASTQAKKDLQSNLNKRKKEEEQFIEECKKLQKKLEKEELVFVVKTGTNDKVFGSISAKQIYTKLKDLGYDIDKKSIHIIDPITNLGTTLVEIELHKEVKFNIKIVLKK